MEEKKKYFMYNHSRYAISLIGTPSPWYISPAFLLHGVSFQNRGFQFWPIRIEDFISDQSKLRISFLTNQNWGFRFWPIKIEDFTSDQSEPNPICLFIYLDWFVCWVKECNEVNDKRGQSWKNESHCDYCDTKSNIFSLNFRFLFD